MQVTKTNLEDCFVIQPTVLNDDRGYFLESFNALKFEQTTGIKTHFVQDNESLSAKNVLRGLHFQKGKHAQAKLVRVVKGRVLDVVVDIRPQSKTYGQHFKIILSEENKTQLYVPRGFAHGFLTLESHTLFAYKCDNFYKKESEGGIIYNDSTLNIDWEINTEQLIISNKDKMLPNFKDLAL